MGKKLDPLPESEGLVNELGKMYGGPKPSKVYIGDQAREETAKTESPRCWCTADGAKPFGGETIRATNTRQERGLLQTSTQGNSSID